MGLDWNPIGKPKPGFEAEYEALFREIGKTKRTDPNVKALQQKFFAVSILPFETLKAPRVGVDAAADKWAMRDFAARKNREITRNQWFESWRGYYVLQLIPDNDGLPVYSNFPLGIVERYSFRAEFLRDCEEWLGDLLPKAWKHHRVPELVDYGRRLQAAATEFGRRMRVGEDVLERREPPPGEGFAAQAHLVASAARWCLFWAERGHSLEADW
jgi:hypothetical protein